MPALPSSYDPNGIGVDNGNFLGLPRVDEPRVVFLAAPYGVTVSYGGGTGGGPANVLTASRQLDVCLDGLAEPWTVGLDWREVAVGTAAQLTAARQAAERVMSALEAGTQALAEDIATVDVSGRAMNEAVRAAVAEALRNDGFPVLIGGEHAVSLGAFRAVAEHVRDFGVLQIDAHMDLREAYEGFRYSHASVMRNALDLPQLQTLLQVGVRDWCPEERALAARSNGRIITSSDASMQRAKLTGRSWGAIVHELLKPLPQNVWISFDIDGLNPSLCMHTGTPVPGGLSFAEAQYLTRAVIESGRRVWGVDIVEVAAAPHEYEGAVAARLAYDIACRAVLAQDV